MFAAASRPPQRCAVVRASFDDAYGINERRGEWPQAGTGVYAGSLGDRRERRLVRKRA